MSNQISPLPDVPSPTDPVDIFDAKAFAFNAALGVFGDEANAVALEMQNNADVAAALLLGMALPQYAGTSTTSLSIGTGAKSFVTQSGKSWVVGQEVVASNGSSYMKGTVTGYVGTALDVNVTRTSGSGTLASWTIGLSYKALGLAPRAQRVDVATVTGTVDLTAAAPDSDDIQFTGNNAMTGFTAKAGRVFRFVVKTGDTPSLVNGANLKTQTGANIQLAGGDSGALRVVTDNVVEVLDFSRAIPTGADLAQSSVTPSKLSQPATLGTSQATTSGTSFDFTGIPSWVNEVTFPLSGVSTNGASPVVVRLGTSGGIESTGYASSSGLIAGINTTTIVSSTTDFLINLGAATALRHGALTFTRLSGNTWIVSGNITDGASGIGVFNSGSKTLAAALDRIRLTTSNGTDTFDAGSINILYK